MKKLSLLTIIIIYHIELVRSLLIHICRQQISLYLIVITIDIQLLTRDIIHPSMVLQTLKEKSIGLLMLDLIPNTSFLEKDKLRLHIFQFGEITKSFGHLQDRFKIL